MPFNRARLAICPCFHYLCKANLMHIFFLFANTLKVDAVKMVPPISSN